MVVMMVMMLLPAIPGAIAVIAAKNPNGCAVFVVKQKMQKFARKDSAWAVHPSLYSHYSSTPIALMVVVVVVLITDQPVITPTFSLIEHTHTCYLVDGG